MSRFEKQIEDLQKMNYKDYSIRVFVFGDYEFLCALYGISGATGRHRCLFCYATASEMKCAKHENLEIKDRTLEDLFSDHKKFIESGGLKKNVKNFNNVIEEPILKIPLDQVSLPSLHMALGIYLNFFNLFEEEVHQLDILIAAETLKSNANFSEEYTIFVSKQKQLLNLQAEILIIDDQIQSINDVVLLAAVNNSDNFENIQSLYFTEIELLNSEKAEKTLLYSTLYGKHSLGLDQSPCTKMIETILQKLKVQRQAYHGKSFVGNHVHKMLKKSSILQLCNCIPKLVHEEGYSGTNVHLLAVDISNKYKQLFDKFAQCYKIFSSRSIVTPEDLILLKKNIKSLMQFYRANWPEASVTPKLHMLEHHAIPFLKEWGAGFGFYGEQGGESIHMEFNKFKTIYQSIPCPTMRLKSILKSHYQKTNPENIRLKPRVKKRIFSKKVT